MKLLSIHIPTIVGREEQFDKLYQHLLLDIDLYHVDRSEVEIISEKDNKKMSIGEKRQLLLNRCDAQYFVQIDDDDMVKNGYIATVIGALKEFSPDCIGYLEGVQMNGVSKIAAHSDRFADWGENIEGYDYVRTIFCKDVIRTDIARKIGFSDMRFGEDHDFSRRLKSSGLITWEVFINEIMYYYEGNNLNADQHRERYGIPFTK
jgi:hypothetical protein